jgi:hypothetical protein
MANDGFNGSTVVFASATLGDLRGIDYSETAAEADCTAADDTIKVYETGVPDRTVSVDFVGTAPAIGIGSKGALTITWNDGTTDGIVAAVCSELGSKGQMDGELTSTAKFKPSTAA